MEISSGISITSLLSGIAFQLSMAGSLPDIGYIIYIDKVFYTCYFLIALSMVRSLVCFYLEKSGDPEKIILSTRLDIALRLLFPLLFLGGLVIFI